MFNRFMKKKIITLSALFALVITIFIVAKGNMIEERYTFSANDFTEYNSYSRNDISGAYKRLIDGLPVNMLVVGDSIGFGTGASGSENAWPSLVSDYLTDTYGSEARLTNISMGGCDSICGYTRVKSLSDEECYDLAVICYGENDREEDFGLYYETIIRALRQKYPNIDIICIQESSQREYTYKMQQIELIAEHYGYPVVDTIEPFCDDYDNLVKDGTHPNNDGYKIYADEIAKTIDKMVEEQTSGIYKETKDIEPFCEEALRFDDFLWISKDEFKRFGNAYSVNISGMSQLPYSDKILLLTDIYDFSGENSIVVLNNSTKVAERAISWPYEFKQRHIPILADGITVEDGSFRIVINNKDQADTFEGIGMVFGRLE